MNKVDLVRSAMERHELSRKDAMALVDGVFEDIEKAVLKGEAVKIPGFGQFKVRDRAARMGRNPATGESIKIAAKRVFKFLPAKALKDAIMSKKGASAKSGLAKATKTAKGRAGASATRVSRGTTRKGAATRAAARPRPAAKKTTRRKAR